MGATFSFFHSNRFPDCPQGDHKSLFNIPVQMELQGHPARTTVKLSETCVYGQYERYHVYHEAVRRVRGRTYEGTDFEEFYQKNEFDAFYDRSENTLVCAAGKSLAHSFVEYLNKIHPSDFNADYLHLDFQQLRPRLGEISGIWVSKMSQPFLNCMALYGPNVDKSNMYKLAESLGVASSMLVAHKYQGKSYPVLLSCEYLIAFPTQEPTEVYFQIIRDMQATLFKDAISMLDSKYNKKKRQKVKRS